MRKVFVFAAFCLVATLGLMVSSCGKEEEPLTPVVDDTTADTIPVTPENTPTIIGVWHMIEATQDVQGNVVDMINFYGENFCLTFMEDGTLITSDGINDAQMQWTLEGNQLGFIQAPGAPAVMYELRELTDERLVIVNGVGTGIETTMIFERK